MVKTFISETENLVYKEVAKNTNLLLGKNKTAALSTGLFLRLPIVISVEQSPIPLPKLNKELESFMPYFSAYTRHENTTQVFFTFIYHTEKDFAHISREIVRHGVFLAFVYVHELQHIMRKHVTTAYNTMMERIVKDAENKHELVNIAEDYAINYSIKDLVTASKSKPIQAKWPEIEALCMYNKDHHKKQMSDIDILKDMKANATSVIKMQISDMLSSVSYNGTSLNQPSDGGSQAAQSTDAQRTGKADKVSTEADDKDNALGDLADAIADIIKSNTKGTDTGDLFEKLFSSIKVETGWFKKLKASFKQRVYYKTHDFATSWANLNNTYRKIYKAPKKIFIDNKLNLILSVDHSGSMSTEDLQRLLYLIESESTSISSITVLIHDTKVINEFNISNEFDITTSPEFKAALATRYTSGGTSHGCVFEYIQNKKIADLSTTIYMSFSDNESDIEETFNKYPVMRKLTTYWVCTQNKPVKVPGVNITMC